jgi:hypothetical protein
MLASYGGLLRDRGADVEEIDSALQLRNQKACNPPLEAGEVRRIAESMARNYIPKNDIAIAVKSRADADDVLADIVERCKATPSAAHADDTIDALIVLDETDPLRFVDLTKAMIRTKAINKTELTKLIKTRRSARRVEEGLKEIVDVVGLDDELAQLKIPHGYKNGDGGLYHIGDDGPVEVICVPLWIKRRLRTVIEKEEKIELVYKRDGDWHSIIAGRSVASFTEGLKILSDRGLPVTGSNQKAVVAYLTAFEALNRDKIPLEQTVTKAGWIGSSLFYPGHSADISYTPEHGAPVTEAAFGTNGSLDDWRATIGEVCRSWPLARLQIAASFASPLLQPTGHRNFVVHLHGDSGSGKSATLMAAMSIWGAPSALVGNFNTTAVGLEHRLSLTNGLPVALNERQHANRKVDDLIYMAGEGVGRTRGAKAGGLRSMQTWQMIMLTNGEEPLVSDRAPEGARTRTIEIEGSPIDDDALASSIYDVTAANHGHAGRLYMAGLLSRLEGGTDKAREDHSYWLDIVRRLGPNKIPAHQSALALILQADAYRLMWIEGLSNVAAAADTAKYAAEIVGELMDRGEGSEAQREYAFLVDLVNSNRGRFASEWPGGSEPPQSLDNGATWGVYKNGKVWMYPTVYRDQLEDAGFRPKATSRRLGSLYLLEGEPHGVNQRTRWTRRKNYQSWVVLHMPQLTQESNGTKGTYSEGEGTSEKIEEVT